MKWWWWYCFIIQTTYVEDNIRSQADRERSSKYRHCWLWKRLFLSRLWEHWGESSPCQVNHRVSPLPWWLWVMPDICRTTRWSRFEKSAWYFLTMAYLWYGNIFVLKGRNFLIAAVCNVSLEPALFAEGKYLSWAFVWIFLNVNLCLVNRTALGQR